MIEIVKNHRLVTLNTEVQYSKTVICTKIKGNKGVKHSQACDQNYIGLGPYKTICSDLELTIN